MLNPSGLEYRVHPHQLSALLASGGAASLLEIPYVNSRNRLIGNYLVNQSSNGLRGGADIGYPYKIHCSNGVAEQAQIASAR